MTGLCFVDSIVPIYRRDPQGGPKQRRATLWMEYLWTERNGVISVQVVNEMYARLTRSSLDRRDWAAFRRDCERLPQWRVQPLDRDVIVRAWAIQDRYQLSWWDALIVSAAKEGGCRYLLTEDLQAGQDFDGLLVVDPFTTAPSDLA